MKKGAWWKPVARLLPQNEAKRRAKQDLAERYCAAGATKVSDGRYASALASYNRALCLQREALGEDHPTTGSTLNSIGFCLTNLEEYAGAAASLNEALYIRLAEFGPDSDETKETERNLAQLAHRKSRRESPPAAATVRAVRRGASDGAGPSRRHSEVVSDRIDWHYDEFAHLTQRRRHSDDPGLSLQHLEPSTPDNIDDWHYKEYVACDIPDGDHVSTAGTAETDDEDNAPIPTNREEEEMAYDSPARRSLEEARVANPPRGDSLRSSAEISSAVDDIVESEVANIMASLSSFQVGPEGEVQISNKDDGTARRGSLKMVSF